MKIVYMGTPEFAVAPLERLAEAGHEILAVITQPDKQKDRGKKVQSTPVKEKAVSLNIPVWQPEKLRGNTQIVKQLKALNADVFVVAAYGKILPIEILSLPRLGCLNIHGSLLPKYRGAAPIQRAILDGEEETGVTIMYMEEGLDTGDMLAFYRTPIGKKTAAILHDELSSEGAKLLVDTLPLLERGELTPEKQDDALSCYSPMITKEEGKIDFNASAVAIERKIRAFNPWPSAFATYKGDTVKIWEAEALGEASGEAAGTIIGADASGMKVATGQGVLCITKLQFPGKKAVSVKDYLLGNQISLGASLCAPD